MKRILSLGAVVVLLGLSLAAPAAVDLKNAAEKKGWHLGMQLNSFKDETFLKAIERTRDLGMKYVEIFGDQTFSKEAGKDFKVNNVMTAEQKALVKKTLADAGIKAVSFGVYTPKDEEGWKQLFDFAKEMGLEFVNAEPKNDEVTAKLLEKMTQETGIKVAIHNHPKPSIYWDPQSLLDFMKKAGNSPSVGSVTDNGHFVRSGLDPLKCVRELKGHTLFFHFKDLNATLAQVGGDEKKLHDVPWGTGINDVWAVMGMMNRWKWRGCLLSEYEYWTPAQQEELRQSFEFLNMVAAAMDKEGWEPVFKDDLSNAQMQPGAWKSEGGVFSTDGKGKGDLYSKDAFGDFILDLEFQNAADTNSGVFVRTADLKDWLNTGIEVQILQAGKEGGKHATGAIYDVKGVEKNAVKPAGQWNHMTVIARKAMIYVMLNGHQVNCINLDQWTEAGKNPDGTANKFKKIAYKDMARKGFIGLQNHGKTVAYRNVKIKALD